MMLRLDLSEPRRRVPRIETTQGLDLVFPELELDMVMSPWLRRYSGAWMGARLVSRWSTLALREGEAVGACLVDRAAGEPNLFALGAKPNLRRTDLARALLERSIELVQADGESVLWAELEEDQDSQLFLSLGFSMVIEAPRMSEEAVARTAVANMYAEMGSSDKAAAHYRKAAARLREVGDSRAEGLDFVASRVSQRNFLYWCNLGGESPAPGTSVEYHLVSPTPQLVQQLSSMIVEVFFDHPAFLTRFLSSGSREVSTVALHGGNPVGACLVSTEEDGATVNAIMVSPNYRRRGLGRAMMYRSLEKLRDTGAKAVLAHVVENNHASLATFTSLGFHRIETLEQLLEFGARSRVIEYRDLIRVVGKERKEEAMSACCGRKIAVLNPR